MSSYLRYAKLMKNSRYLKPIKRAAAGGAALGIPSGRAYGKYKKTKKVYKKARPSKINSSIPKNKMTKTLNMVKNFMGNLEYRVFDSKYNRTGGYNQQALVACDVIDMAAYEAILGQLRFFNPAVPGTLTTASGASGTYYREYLFKSVSTVHTARNNYQTPCRCTLYVCTPREDTSVAPATAFSNGLADVSNGSATSTCVSLRDSDEFNDLWIITKQKSMVLNPGQSMTISHGFKNMLYSPATYDSHSLSYQRRFKCFTILCRVEGIVAHDSATTEVGLLNAGVDLIWRTSYKVQYDAGGDINYMYISEGVDSFTNGPLVSSYPVADNINYSAT